MIHGINIISNYEEACFNLWIRNIIGIIILMLTASYLEFFYRSLDYLVEEPCIAMGGRFRDRQWEDWQFDSGTSAGRTNHLCS